MLKATFLKKCKEVFIYQGGNRNSGSHLPSSLELIIFIEGLGILPVNKVLNLYLIQVALCFFLDCNICFLIWSDLTWDFETLHLDPTIWRGGERMRKSVTLP